MRAVLTRILILLFMLWIMAVTSAFLLNLSPSADQPVLYLLARAKTNPLDAALAEYQRWDRQLPLLACAARSDDLATGLAQARVIRSAFFFRCAARVIGLDERIQPGWRRLEPGISTWEILERLTRVSRCQIVWTSPGESLAALTGRFARAGMLGDPMRELHRAVQDRPEVGIPETLRFYAGPYLIDPGKTTASEVAHEAILRHERALGRFMAMTPPREGNWQKRLVGAVLRERGAFAPDAISPSLRFFVMK